MTKTLDQEDKVSPVTKSWNREWKIETQNRKVDLAEQRSQRLEATHLCERGSHLELTDHAETARPWQASAAANGDGSTNGTVRHLVVRAHSACCI